VEFEKHPEKYVKAQPAGEHAGHEHKH